MVPFVVKLLSLQQSLQEPLLGEELAPAEVVMALTMLGDHRGSVIALPGMSLATDAVSSSVLALAGSTSGPLYLPLPSKFQSYYRLISTKFGHASDDLTILTNLQIKLINKSTNFTDLLWETSNR